MSISALRYKYPLLRRIPDGLLRIVIAVLALTVATAAGYGLFKLFGRPSNPILILLLFLVIMGTAWLGYIPGLIVITLATFGIPWLFTGHVRTTNPLAFAALCVLSLIVSYAGDRTRKRHRALERRLRVRSAEAARAASSMREVEERLRFVLDSASIGYFDYDTANGVVIRSPKHDHIYGYPQPLPEWNYEIFMRHVHPEDRDAVAASIERTLKEGADYSEFRIVRPNGEVRWLSVEGRALAGKKGPATHVGGVIADVTERRNSESHLREQAQLLDLAHGAILSLDNDGAIRFWNRGAEAMYGWNAEEASGQEIHGFLQSVFPEPLESIEEKLKTLGHWEGELTQTCRDGSELHVASRWAARYSPDGSMVGWREINLDITERRRRDEQLRHTQKLESLGVLAGGVAHDFNNLLTGILGNASLALDTMTGTNPNRGFLEEVMKAAERAADLTRQLLAYAGKGRFVMRTVNLSTLVRDISELIQASIPKVVQLKQYLASPLPGIDADPGQLQQIVMNLVINAAEAIGPEGGTVTVRTGAINADDAYLSSLSPGVSLASGEYVYLEVQDTGAGMDKPTVARIFDPFFTTKFAGRGLGLSAVQGIVQSHKGSLKVYSEPGKGTTFKVFFPASQQPAPEPEATVKVSLQGEGTILVVDDEDIVRMTARNTLERYGYKTVLAADGKQAVSLYRTAPDSIDVVLLDLTMPVMNGEDALRQMQTINPRVRVLLSSGYNEVEAVQRFAGKGLAGFIQKPYTASSLAEKVKEVLRSAPARK